MNNLEYEMLVKLCGEYEDLYKFAIAHNDIENSFIYGDILSKLKEILESYGIQQE